MTQPTAGFFARHALRNGLIAGAIAFAVRLFFALALEHLTVGSALGVAALFFLGTAVVVAAGIMILGPVFARRRG